MNYSVVKAKWQLKLELRFFQLRKLFPAIQILMLLSLVALLVLPLFGPYPRFQWQTPWNNGQLFSEWVLWGFWYPGTLLSVLFVGRLWCGALCPLGALSEWVSRIGGRLNPPNWIKHPIAPAFSFLIVTVWAQTLDVRDDLRSALLLFAIIFALAVACGLAFGSGRGVARRVWCRHLCPIGSVLGVFSRIGVMSIDPANKEKVEEGYRDHGLCPTSIELRSKQSSRHCIKCARCIKPNARGGLSLTLRAPASEIEYIDRHSPCSSELAFIWFAPGLAIAGFIWSSSPLYAQFRQALGEWAMNHQWMGMFSQGPAWLMNQNAAIDQHYLWLDFVSISLFMLGFAALMALILFALSLAGAALLKNDVRTSWIHRLTTFGYQFSPLAMLCILLGLGSTLISSLHQWIGHQVMVDIELSFVVVALTFNLLIAFRWVAKNHKSCWRRILSSGVITLGCFFISTVTLWSIFPSYQLF
ncbi:4Fe-4S binding protein [Vibrio sp. S4M6]|uniref:4Fe-4S binding protein n=1 Tax=Vibrio sinus TaxID=2946865 RepID=UPI00202A8195|nr:4Fe-4S binding protein [Vibrio sinus]MCL9782417.1 4Fe-4S binding protein [Vibrio sinus]